MTPTIIAALTAVLAQPQPVKIAFFGDQGLGSSSEAVLQLCIDEGADAIVHLGDFDYADDPDAWEDQHNAVLPPCFPIFAVAGNHDTSEFAGYSAHIAARLECLGIMYHGTPGDRYALSFNGVYIVLTTPGLLGSGDASYVADRLASPEAAATGWRVSGWHVLMQGHAGRRQGRRKRLGRLREQPAGRGDHRHRP